MIAKSLKEFLDSKKEVFDRLKKLLSPAQTKIIETFSAKEVSETCTILRFLRNVKATIDDLYIVEEYFQEKHRIEEGIGKQFYEEFKRKGREYCKKVHREKEDASKSPYSVSESKSRKPQTNRKKSIYDGIRIGSVVKCNCGGVFYKFSICPGSKDGQKYSVRLICEECSQQVLL